MSPSPNRWGTSTSFGLVSAASVVLTDSGGIQEETTALGVPCLTVRDNTERPITITSGTNRLVGRDRTAILAGVTDVLSSQIEPLCPELWDGRAAERIAKIMVGLPQVFDGPRNDDRFRTITDWRGHKSAA